MAEDNQPIIDIQLTQEQVDYIRTTLTEDNDLETDERQLLNGLLEMAQNHPDPDLNPAWRFTKNP
jgi:hypothetical protein